MTAQFEIAGKHDTMRRETILVSLCLLLRHNHSHSADHLLLNAGQHCTALSQVRLYRGCADGRPSGLVRIISHGADVIAFSWPATEEAGLESRSLGASHETRPGQTAGGARNAAQRRNRAFRHSLV